VDESAITDSNGKLLDKKGLALFFAGEWTSSQGLDKKSLTWKTQPDRWSLDCTATPTSGQKGDRKFTVKCRASRFHVDRRRSMREFDKDKAHKDRVLVAPDPDDDLHFGTSQ
jgi:hypothetical protein